MCTPICFDSDRDTVADNVAKMWPRQANSHWWSQEQAVDLDMASAICPGCKLILLEANTSGLPNTSTAVDGFATGRSAIATAGRRAVWKRCYMHGGTTSRELL